MDVLKTNKDLKLIKVSKLIQISLYETNEKCWNI